MVIITRSDHALPVQPIIRSLEAKISNNIMHFFSSSTKICSSWLFLNQFLYDEKLSIIFIQALTNTFIKVRKIVLKAFLTLAHTYKVLLCMYLRKQDNKFLKIFFSN